MIFDHRSAYLAGECHVAFGVRCSPAVITPGARSLTLTAELLGATGAESCAIVTVHRPNNTDDAISVSAIRFNDCYLLLFHLGWINSGSILM